MPDTSLKILLFTQIVNDIVLILDLFETKTCHIRYIQL